MSNGLLAYDVDLGGKESAFTLSVPPRVRTYDADAARLLLRTSRVQMESSFVQSSYATRKLNKQSIIPIPNSIHEKKNPLPKRQLPMPSITPKNATRNPKTEQGHPPPTFTLPFLCGACNENTLFPCPCVNILCAPPPCPSNAPSLGYIGPPIGFNALASISRMRTY